MIPSNTGMHFGDRACGLLKKMKVTTALFLTTSTLLSSAGVHPFSIFIPDHQIVWQNRLF